MTAPSIPLTRRRWMRQAAALGCGLPWMGAAFAKDDPRPRLAFLGFELIDEQPDPQRAEEHRARLEKAGQQMAQGLEAKGLYEVLDLAPAAQALARARGENEFLYRCNGCLSGVGQALDVTLVGTAWVQRVSNLILNLNLQIQDVSADRLVLTKSVDIRGDNDTSWQRGIAYMLRDMEERRQRQPAYGR